MKANFRTAAMMIAAASLTAGCMAVAQPVNPTPDAPSKMSKYKTDPQAQGEGGANFTGPAKVTGRFPLHGSTRLRSVSAVSFEAGGRTRWHSHPFGQLLVVTHGRGWIQAEGQPAQIMQVGDMIWTAPNVMHWHGGTRSSGVTHAAISEQVEGVEVTWKHAVSDADYRGPE